MTNSPRGQAPDGREVPDGREAPVGRSAGSALDQAPAGYDALRSSVAAFSLSRDVVEVSGPEAGAYLQGQCSQEVLSLSVGAGAEALLLGPEGKVVALVRVSRLAADRFAVDVDGGFGPTVVERLQRFRLRTKVGIETLEWSCVALRGPKTPAPGEAALADAVGEDVVLMVPGGSAGFSGLDLLGPAPSTAVPAGIPEASAAAWEARRVEAGLPLMGAELDERTIPAEAGLLERAVSFTKGCYTGQELVARLEARGNKVARSLRGIVMDEPDAPVVPLRTPVLTDESGRVVGAVTSSAYSPALSRALALGYVHRSVVVGDRVRIGTEAGAPLLPARVVALPAA